jgi:uncharacterized protein YndB with AHSA1/START domain
MKDMADTPDPRRDLELQRILRISPELVWKAWTEPEHLKHWFTPAPWRTVDCQIDLVPGGIFRTVMRSPEGQDFPNLGCYLEIVTYRKLVWTNALEPGFRPAQLDPSHPCDSFFCTAKITLEPYETGTKFSARVLHGDEEGCKKHSEMGFHEGWGKALDQLVAHMKSLREG